MKMLRLTSLLLAMLLTFSLACADTAASSGKVMAVVNGEELRYADYADYEAQYLTAYAAYGYDGTDEAQTAYIQDLALTAAIQDMLLAQDMRAQGCYDFDAQTEAWLAEQGAAAYQAALLNVEEVLRAELGVEADADVSAAALAYANIIGVSADDYIDVYRTQYATAAYYQRLTGDAPVTEDAIHAAYEARVAQSREQYGENAAAFETAMYTNGDVWYRPAGYRSILQILLPAQGDTDEARLTSVKTATDAIQARLEAGESFQALMAEYNTDTAFADPAFLAAGYQVHRDSIVWDAAFVAAAFSEAMQQPGCWSAPVASDKGVHILYYLSDSPSGAVELSQDLHDALGYTLYDELVQSALQQRLTELVKDAVVVVY